MSSRPPLFGFAPPAELPRVPKRIVLHWSAGTHIAEPFQDSEGNWHDPRLSYHMLIEWDGARAVAMAGVPLANNMRRLGQGDVSAAKAGDPARGYAAHIGGWNSFSMGIALCGMKGAWARHVIDRTDWPITAEQVQTLIGMTANATAIYELPVDDHHVFTHYEAWAIHDDERHSDRWDIGWIPQEPDLEIDDVGPWLRQQIQARL